MLAVGGKLWESVDIREFRGDVEGKVLVVCGRMHLKNPW